jgi:hypothetical protein
MRGVVQIETLLGGLEPWNFMTFHSVGNFIIPSTKSMIFQVGQPPEQHFDEHMQDV